MRLLTRKRLSSRSLAFRIVGSFLNLWRPYSLWNTVYNLPISQGLTWETGLQSRIRALFPSSATWVWLKSNHRTQSETETDQSLRRAVVLLCRDKTTRKNALSSLVPILGDTLGFPHCPGSQVSPFHFWMNAWYVFFHSSVIVTCILLFNKKHIIPGWLCLYSKECFSFFYSLQTFQQLFDDALNTKPGISSHSQESTCNMQDAQKCCSRSKHDRCTEEFYLEVFFF